MLTRLRDATRCDDECLATPARHGVWVSVCRVRKEKVRPPHARPPLYHSNAQRPMLRATVLSELLACPPHALRDEEAREETAVSAGVQYALPTRSRTLFPFQRRSTSPCPDVLAFPARTGRPWQSLRRGQRRPANGASVRGGCGQQANQKQRQRRQAPIRASKRAPSLLRVGRIGAWRTRLTQAGRSD